MLNKQMFDLGMHLEKQLAELEASVWHTDLGADVSTQGRLARRILIASLRQASQIAGELMNLGFSNKMHSDWVRQIVQEAREDELAHLRKR